jgi:hypothetical protein
VTNVSSGANLPSAESVRGCMSAILSSWEEIAAHQGKPVRTVQRWERELGLPVNRPLGEKHIVIAYPDELDGWIRQQGAVPDSSDAEAYRAR